MFTRGFSGLSTGVEKDRENLRVKLALNKGNFGAKPADLPSRIYHSKILKMKPLRQTK